MILFRARQWGQGEWTRLAIGGADEDEDSLAATIASIVGSALGTSSLHVQRLGEEGEWEELE